MQFNNKSTDESSNSKTQQHITHWHSIYRPEPISFFISKLFSVTSVYYADLE
jgi:hypothetical protein